MHRELYLWLWGRRGGPVGPRPGDLGRQSNHGSKVVISAWNIYVEMVVGYLHERPVVTLPVSRFQSPEYQDSTVYEQIWGPAGLDVHVKFPIYRSSGVGALLSALAGQCPL